MKQGGFSYIVQIIQMNLLQRPLFNITTAQLQYLRSMSFMWVQIAEILGVHI